MSTGGFERVNPLGEGFIRGPARVLVAPSTAVWPSHLGAIVNLSTEESEWKTEEQELTKFSKEAKKGTFNLGFAEYETAAISVGAKAEEIQKALEALPSIGEGGVQCEGGPLSTAAVKIKFAGSLAKHAQPLIVITQNKTEEEKTTFEVKRTQAGFGLYDPVGLWSDLGSTSGGVKITRNNTEDQIEIDQIQAAITAVPNEWEMTVDVPLAETSLENIQIAWEGGEITTDITRTPNERHLGLGVPAAYTERRMAIIHQKTVGVAAGRFRAHLFRRITRSPTSSSLDFMKTGKQQILPLQMRSFAEAGVADPKYAMGEIVEQSVYL